MSLRYSLLILWIGGVFAVLGQFLIVDPEFDHRWFNENGGDIIDAAIASDGSFLVAKRTGEGNTLKIDKLSPDGILDEDYSPPTIVVSSGMSELKALENGGALLFFQNGRRDGEMIRGTLYLNDGTIDPNFFLNISLNGLPVPKLSVEPFGPKQFILGGQFNLVNGLSAQKIVLVNRDGSLSQSLDYGSGAQLEDGRDGTIDSALPVTLNRLWVKGRFDRFNNVPAYNYVILRLLETAPSVRLEPKTYDVEKGFNIELAPKFAGYPIHSIQWLREDEVIQDSHQERLFLHDIQPEQAGTYSIILSNHLGEAKQAIAKIKHWDGELEFSAESDTLEFIRIDSHTGKLEIFPAIEDAGLDHQVVVTVQSPASGIKASRTIDVSVGHSVGVGLIGVGLENGVALPHQPIQIPIRFNWSDALRTQLECLNWRFVLDKERFDAPRLILNPPSLEGALDWDPLTGVATVELLNGFHEEDAQWAIEFTNLGGSQTRIHAFQVQHIEAVASDPSTKINGFTFQSQIVAIGETPLLWFERGTEGTGSPAFVLYGLPGHSADIQTTPSLFPLEQWVSWSSVNLTDPVTRIAYPFDESQRYFRIR